MNVLSMFVWLLHRISWMAQYLAQLSQSWLKMPDLAAQNASGGSEFLFCQSYQQSLPKNNLKSNSDCIAVLLRLISPKHQFVES